MVNDFDCFREEISCLRGDVESLKKMVIALTKAIESFDTELTDYGKEQLLLAREESELNYSSLGDVEKSILSDELSD